MTTRKFGRTALIAVLALSIVMSITGGTIAWFTDEVTSTNNVIQAGTLDVKLYYSDDAAAWTDIEDENAEKALFNYDKWEPGYTAVKYVKIENAGNLAFNYQFDVNASSIVAEGNANLAKVIDVYVADASAGKLDKAAALANKVASLEELKGDKLFKAGTLEAKAEGATENPSVVLCLALHMQEEAGNEYQDCSLSNIAIKLVATQATVEKDAFDTQYDADADFPKDVDPNLPVADVAVMEDSEKDEIFFFTQNTNELRSLDVGYVFKTTQTYDEAKLNPYAKWHADFVVTLDKDLPALSAGLAGSYESYKNGDWIGFDLTQEIIDDVTGTTNGLLPAGTEFRLLDSYNDAEVTMNYEELCLLVEEFQCGAYAIGNGAEGATMTVQLRLYEVTHKQDSQNNSWNEETGEYVVIAEYKYTF